MPEFKVGDRIEGSVFAVEPMMIMLDTGSVLDTSTCRLMTHKPAFTFDLEPGRFYLTNDGKKLLIHWIGDEYAFGVLLVNNHKTPVSWWLSAKNYIIAPWPDKPIVDWAAMPRWINGVFCNPQRNRWLAYYGVKPKVRDVGWYFPSGLTTIDIPPAYYPTNSEGKPWEGDWKDSLVERPEVEV